MRPNYFKNACRVATEYSIHRYLICNSAGRLDGVEKAEVHRELCNFYIAIKHGLSCSDKAGKYIDDFELVHEATSKLTSYMDTEIGLPISDRPDYDKLVPLFFEKFHDLATHALNIEE